MLETIRQFAEEQLVARGEADEVRTAHARYFAGREADIMALWDSPRQREAYDWFTAELANLRTAFRWAADHGDLDAAAAIATYAGFSAIWVEQLRADSLGRGADRARPRRRPSPARVPVCDCVASAGCAGRIEAAVGYGDAGQTVIGSGREEVPFGIEGLLGGAYLAIGQPERWVECVPRPARTRSRHPRTHQGMPGLALTVAGCPSGGDGRRERSDRGRRGHRQPVCARRSRFCAYGFAFRDADPVRALDALRRGLVIAQDSGNRTTSHTWRPFWPVLRPTRRPAGRARSPHSGDPQLPRLGQHHRDPQSPWRSSPPFSTGSAATNRRPPSPVSPLSPLTARHPRDQHRDRPPPRSPRRPDLRIARPQGRDNDHRRHGDLRLRPDRPGPNRTERRLEIDELRESRK